MVPGLRPSSLHTQKWHQTWGIANPVFYSIGGLFPNHLDSGFHSIVDDLLEAVGMRLGFHFIGVEGEASVGNNIVNAVWYMCYENILDMCVYMYYTYIWVCLKMAEWTI